LIARQLTLNNQNEQQTLPEVRVHQPARSPGGLAVIVFLPTALGETLCFVDLVHGNTGHGNA
jgi:hypothetical protein